MAGNTQGIMPPANPAIPNRLLRLPEVTARTCKSRSVIYRELREGKFPAPLKIGPHAVAWRECDIADWMATRPSARSAALAADGDKP